MSPEDEVLGPVRLLFELSRDDNPRLYDDLIRFNKGTKRVNRLRLLAHEGLLAQERTETPSVAPLVRPPTQRAGATVNASAARHTNQAFEEPPVAR